jgi:hypothetical protein
MGFFIFWENNLVGASIVNLNAASLQAAPACQSAVRLSLCAKWQGHVKALPPVVAAPSGRPVRINTTMGAVAKWQGMGGCKCGYDKVGGDAEEAEALVCKTSLSGFESRRYLQFSSTSHDGNRPWGERYDLLVNVAMRKAGVYKS